MTVLLGSAAVALDIGWRRLVQQELQNAADAAALAGAAVLVSEGPDGARVLAKQVAAMNRAGGEPVALLDDDIEIGTWNGATWVVDEDEGDMVRVVTTRLEVPRVFGGALGWANPPTSRAAIASAAGGSGSCGFFSELEMTVTGVPPVHSGVCSNDDITVKGTPNIEGDVTCGPGEEVKTSGAYDIGGEIGELPEEIAIDFPSENESWRNASLSCPSGVSCNSTVADLSLSGPRTLNLSAGSYRWKNIKTSGQAKINITSGPVYIHATGSCDLAGQGVVNTTGDPDQLVVYCKKDASLSGNAGWYGTLYSGGNMSITGGGAGWDFHGMAMAGGEMKISGNVELFASGELLSGGGTGTTPRLVR